ncbi:MAG TPA: MarR family transcriptional regulator [Gemmatimonadales bacterium]|nr:MarR family transcriptional regulator [Gemmatimonadales bacterium]
MPTPRPPAPARSAVQQEIRQSRPFRSTAQEATVALLRTASVVSRVVGRVLEPYRLSPAQYNALRVVRGAGPGGVPTLAVRERMIEAGTTITRILDKLETAGLVRRERGEPDRRLVRCYATAKGTRLLAELDPKVDAADEAAMAGLSGARLRMLIELLDTIRATNAVPGAPRHAPVMPPG